MKTGKGSHTTVICDQNSIVQARRSTGTFCDILGVGIGDLAPGCSVCRPLQVELGTRQRFALFVYFLDCNLTGLDAVGEGHLHSLTTLDCHSLRVIGFAHIERILGDNFLDLIVTGKQCFSQNRAVFTRGVGSNERIIADTVNLEYPSCYAASIRHGLNQFQPATLVVDEGHTLGFTGNHRNLLYSSIEGPLGIGCRLIHFSNVVITGQKPGGDYTAFITGKGRSIN